MASTADSPSRRQVIRDASEAVLQQARAPLHYKQIAQQVLPRLGLDQIVSAKVVNNSLHDDPEHRFRLVGKGLWVLASKPLKP